MSAASDRYRLAHALAAALSTAVGQAERISLETSPDKAPVPSKAISFAPELVNALLAGRKTETRRLIRPQPSATTKKMPSIARCPLAQPGDRLHVREPWAEVDGRYVYAADGEFGIARYRPAMFMPRAASRLTLNVTAVFAERLQTIAPAAARAEGAPAGVADPVFWFAALWDRIFANTGQRWADDPFVWVIHFRLDRLAQQPQAAR